MAEASYSCLSVNSGPDLPKPPTYTLKPPYPTDGRAIFLRHSIGQTTLYKYGNINPLSIDYAFRPRLRLRLTLGGFTWPRNPWIFGGRDSHPPCRYSSQHLLLCYLQCSLPVHLHQHAQCSPTTYKSPQLRYIVLAPLHFRRRITGPVSYYAFFKGWLLLSQPPGCQSNPTSFAT